MKTSQETDKILPKLFNIQEKVKSVTKNAKNEHFKNDYADLNEILEATKSAVHDNKCLLLQPPTFILESGKEMLETIIMDSESGQFVAASMFIEGADAQKRGGCVTYTRRITLKSLLALEEDDDDGNTATGKPLASEPTKRTSGFNKTEASPVAPREVPAAPAARRGSFGKA